MRQLERTVSWLSYTQFHSCQKELKIPCGQTILSPASNELGLRVARGRSCHPQKQQPDDTKPSHEISFIWKPATFFMILHFGETNKQKRPFLNIASFCRLYLVTFLLRKKYQNAIWQKFSSWYVVVVVVFFHFPIFKALVTQTWRNITRIPGGLFWSPVVLHLTKIYWGPESGVVPSICFESVFTIVFCSWSSPGNPHIVGKEVTALYHVYVP